MKSRGAPRRNFTRIGPVAKANAVLATARVGRAVVRTIARSVAKARVPVRLLALLDRRGKVSRRVRGNRRVRGSRRIRIEIRIATRTAISSAAAPIAIAISGRRVRRMAAMAEERRRIRARRLKAARPRTEDLRKTAEASSVPISRAIQIGRIKAGVATVAVAADVAGTMARAGPRAIQMLHRVRLVKAENRVAIVARVRSRLRGRRARVVRAEARVVQKEIAAHAKGAAGLIRATPIGSAVVVVAVVGDAVVQVMARAAVRMAAARVAAVVQTAAVAGPTRAARVAARVRAAAPGNSHHDRRPPCAVSS